MIYVTACIRFALVVMSFVACLFVDLSPRQQASYDDQSEKKCPKYYASFLSVIFFWWFTR